eukprot:TRINITY_DN76133_c0_g1_i1.p1 TRINITY_DN76133_c0_g1~~TRINITY_DN76133_c0_g1_i1.p1  ORF type:complete len:368 (-),score=205.02 TRINITY_DN76133_c0_g1_i1:30-1076(-)
MEVEKERERSKELRAEIRSRLGQLLTSSKMLMACYSVLDHRSDDPDAVECIKWAQSRGMLETRVGGYWDPISPRQCHKMLREIQQRARMDVLPNMQTIVQAVQELQALDAERTGVVDNAIPVAMHKAQDSKRGNATAHERYVAICRLRDHLVAMSHADLTLPERRRQLNAYRNVYDGASQASMRRRLGRWLGIGSFGIIRDAVTYLMEHIDEPDPGSRIRLMVDSVIEPALSYMREFVMNNGGEHRRFKVNLPLNAVADVAEQFRREDALKKRHKHDMYDETDDDVGDDDGEETDDGTSVGSKRRLQALVVQSTADPTVVGSDVDHSLSKRQRVSSSSAAARRRARKQ